jgi:hypothetical protein
MRTKGGQAPKHLGCFEKFERSHSGDAFRWVSRNPTSGLAIHNEYVIARLSIYIKVSSE